MISIYNIHDNRTAGKQSTHGNRICHLKVSIEYGFLSKVLSHLRSWCYTRNGDWHLRSYAVPMSGMRNKQSGLRHNGSHYAQDVQNCKVSDMHLIYYLRMLSMLGAPNLINPYVLKKCKFNSEASSSKPMTTKFG